MTSVFFFTFTFFLSNSWISLMLSIFMIFLMFMFPQWSSTTMSLSNTSLFDLLTWSMIWLACLITFFMLLTESKNLVSSKNLSCLSLIMLFSLTMIFLSKNILSFYFFFEFSLLPITLMILGWGYQPERLSAASAMLLYTILASLPLLWVILKYWVTGFIHFHSLSWCPSFTHNLDNLINFTILIAFLTKFPMFMVHLWLPKAHVEAPVVGSMILAALLLKLAGFGMWRFSTELTNLGHLNILKIFQMIALMGGIIISILCLTQKDMKVLIAYSSVSHMSLAIFCMLSFTPIGILTTLVLMVSHGISSSGMFCGANFIYSQLHSRNLLLTNGFLTLLPSFMIVWFLVCMGNMGSPPTVNFLSEILASVTILKSWSQSWLYILLAIFFSVPYTLMVFISPAQGQLSKLSNFSSQMFNLSLLILIGHSYFLIFSCILFMYSSINNYYFFYIFYFFYCINFSDNFKIKIL